MRKHAAVRIAWQRFGHMFSVIFNGKLFRENKNSWQIKREQRRENKNAKNKFPYTFYISLSNTPGQKIFNRLYDEHNTFQGLR